MHSLLSRACLIIDSYFLPFSQVRAHVRTLQKMETIKLIYPFTLDLDFCFKTPNHTCKQSYCWTYPWERNIVFFRELDHTVSCRAVEGPLFWYSCCAHVTLNATASNLISLQSCSPWSNGVAVRVRLVDDELPTSVETDPATRLWSKTVWSDGPPPPPPPPPPPFSCSCSDVEFITDCPDGFIVREGLLSSCDPCSCPLSTCLMERPDPSWSDPGSHMLIKKSDGHF